MAKIVIMTTTEKVRERFTYLTTINFKELYTLWYNLADEYDRSECYEHPRHVEEDETGIDRGPLIEGILEKEFSEIEAENFYLWNSGYYRRVPGDQIAIIEVNDG